MQRLIVEGDGIVVTNAAGLAWLSHERLAAMRSDVIHVQLLGRGDGSTGVDYTVNAAIGYPSSPARRITRVRSTTCCRRGMCAAACTPRSP